MTALAVGPGGARAYAGAANGGPWFSPDGGASWSPLDDYLVSPSLVTGAAEDSLSVGALTVAFGASAATDVVYVGTGEPAAGDGYFGIGVRRSPVGGAAGTWLTEATNLASRAIYRLTIDPDNNAIVYAATSVGIFRRPAAAPFATWAQVTSPVFTNANGAVSDLIVVGTGASKRFYAAFSGDGVYSSVDGATWTALTGVPGGSGRIALAAGESTPTIYAFTSAGSLLRLVGTAFQAVAGLPPASIFFRGQGGYDLVVGVDPANDNTVYLVGATMADASDWNLSFLKGTITGGPGAYVFPFNAANAANPTADPTWIGRGVHADGHSFAFALNAVGPGHLASDVWVGTDGGIFRSTSSGAAGSFRAANNGLAITELTFIAGRQDTDAVVFAGSQDNGTVRYSGEAAWFESPEGDGGGAAVDPNNQYQVMRQYVRTVLSISTDGGASGAWPGLNFPPITAATLAQQSAANTEYSAAGFYGPIATSPAGVIPTMVVYGTNRPWLSTNWGTSWVTLPAGTNPYAPATPDAAQDVLDGQPITAIAVASGNRIFVATRSSVWRFDLAAAVWSRTAITTVGLPISRYITDLAVVDAAAGTFYASLGWAGVNHLWFFDGAAWVAAGPPPATLDVPCNAIAIDPANPTVVFLGSDVGCWRGTKTGATTWAWALFSQGLPECAINDLEVHARARLLRAATHGRGAWEIELDAAAGIDPDLYVRVDTADTGRLSGATRFPWVENHQDPSRPGFNVAHWMSPDIKVRRASLAAPDPLNTPPDFVDFAVNIDDYVDTTDIETADLTGVNRIFVQVHNRGRTAVAGAQVRVLLLLTDAAAGLPALPADYVTRINAGDSTNWVAGSLWRFADPTTPYRSLPANLDVRVPGVVEYDVDFSSLALPAGHNHVCAAAFVTTSNSALVGGTTSMDQLTMQDPHAAHRNLHLVALGSRPAPPAGATSEPQTVVLNLCSAKRRAGPAELIVERSAFPGSMSLVLPQFDGLELKGWEPFERERAGSDLGDHVGRWLQRVGEFVEIEGERIEQAGQRLRNDHFAPEVRRDRLQRLVDLQKGRTFVARGEGTLSIAGIPIEANSCITTALTLEAPKGAKPGDRYGFDVIQRQAGRIIGGSSYVVVVAKPSRLQ